MRAGEEGFKQKPEYETECNSVKILLWGCLLLLAHFWLILRKADPTLSQVEKVCSGSATVELA